MTTRNYFNIEQGLLREIWEQCSHCGYCGEKRIDLTEDDECGSCNSGTKTMIGSLRKALAPLAKELMFAKGDPVDVFVKEAFGWMEGEVKDLRIERFCYAVRLESLYHGERDVEIPFWPDAGGTDGALALAPHRTHCLDDWRATIKDYTHFECMEDGRWVQCQKVFQTGDKILVVTDGKEEKSHWFRTDSPEIRMLWEFRE